MKGMLVRHPDHSTLGGDEQTRTLGLFEGLRSRPINVKRIQFMPGDLPGLPHLFTLVCPSGPLFHRLWRISMYDFIARFHTRAAYIVHVHIAIQI